MYSEMILSTIKSYTMALSQNATMKFLIGIIPWILATIFNSHQELIWFVIFGFFIDLILWVIYAMKNWEFNLPRFTKWLLKILPYWILLSMWLLLDKVLHTGEFIIGILFTFIILRDVNSILLKIHLLWFYVPMFLIKYIWIARTRLEDKVSVFLNLTRQEKDAIADCNDIKEKHRNDINLLLISAENDETKTDQISNKN